jgi:hypothetical protein
LRCTPAGFCDKYRADTVGKSGRGSYLVETISARRRWIADFVQPPVITGYPRIRRCDRD